MQTAVDILRFAMSLTDAGTVRGYGRGCRHGAGGGGRVRDAGVNLTNWDPVVGQCLAKPREGIRAGARKRA
jgi:hypothetical protein